VLIFSSNAANAITLTKDIPTPEGAKFDSQSGRNRGYIKANCGRARAISLAVIILSQASAADVANRD
jgi:hypothetical protein